MGTNQLTRIGHVVSNYYQQPEEGPQPQHFHLWISSLAEPTRTVFSEKSFDRCKDVLDFRRFVAELNDGGLEEHMQRHLTGTDYRLWQQQGEQAAATAKFKPLNTASVFRAVKFVAQTGIKK